MRRLLAERRECEGLRAVRVVPLEGGRVHDDAVAHAAAVGLARVPVVVRGALAVVLPHVHALSVLGKNSRLYVVLQIV